MESQSNWIRLVEEEEPPATEFLRNYWSSLGELPESLKFLEGASIESLSSNKSYLLALFNTKKREQIVAKIDLDCFNGEIEGAPTSLVDREAKVLKSISKLDISPTLICTHTDQETEEGQLPNILFTTLEGLGNNLHDQPTQDWWELYKKELVKELAKIHSEEALSGIPKGFKIKDWYNNFIFDEENIAEFILEPHTTEDLFEFLDKLQNTCNEILDTLDEKTFTLCHNNLSKSTVLHNPNTDSKFKFINFHKSIVGPRELDIHSIYHRLGLEEYDTRGDGFTNSKDDFLNLYFQETGYRASFSHDFKFLNTVQRIMMLLFENNMAPTVLYQSNLNRKFAHRNAEFGFLKKRLFSTIIDNSFNYHRDYINYVSKDPMPFSELILYG